MDQFTAQNVAWLRPYTIYIRRTNLGQMIKPTIPRLLVQHGPWEESGCFPCKGKEVKPCGRGACDLCKHVEITYEIVSPYDNRKWKIKRHLTCTTPNLIYLMICTHCDDKQLVNMAGKRPWYVGSTAGDERGEEGMGNRWRNHRADIVNKKWEKCTFTQHFRDHAHPQINKRNPIPFIKVIFLDSCKPNATKDDLLYKEVWWQSNIGTLFFGLNERNDLMTVERNKR